MRATRPFAVDVVTKYSSLKVPHNYSRMFTSGGILRTGEPEIGNGYQMWQKRGSQIACQVAPNEVLDIRGANTDDGAEVQCFIEHGGENQCWHFEYL